MRRGFAATRAATTDLAAVRHRTDAEKASRVVYCTDAGQGEHFDKVFQIARRAGWGEGVSLEHVPFGLVWCATPLLRRSAAAVRQALAHRLYG